MMADNYYYTDAIADQAIRYIRENTKPADKVADKPFFLYVAFTSPHWPLHTPPETIAKYKGLWSCMTSIEIAVNYTISPHHILTVFKECPPPGKPGLKPLRCCR